MKKVNGFVLLFLMSWSMVFCQADKKMLVTIHGKLTNNVSGKVYFEKLNDRNIARKIDSVQIKNQLFDIQYTIDEPGIYQVNIASEQVIGIILEGGETLKLEADGVATPEKPAKYKIEGSKTFSTFQRMMEEVRAYNQTQEGFDAKIKKEKNAALKTKMIQDFNFNKEKFISKLKVDIATLGSSAAGMIASINLLTSPEDVPFLEEQREKIVKDKKDHFFAKMFMQFVSQQGGGAVGTKAPDFELMTMEGKKFKLSELKGKTVILDFWATWCGPCIMSFPGMKLATEKYKNNPNVVFGFVNTFERVAVNEWNGYVQKFVKNRGFNFMDPVMDIGGNTATLYGVNGIPAKFCIGADGKIKHKGSGYLGSDQAVLKEMTEWIEK